MMTQRKGSETMAMTPGDQGIKAAKVDARRYKVANRHGRMVSVTVPESSDPVLEAIAEGLRISSLWIVTKPTPYSTLEDLYFEANAQRLELQFRGGLKGDDVAGMFTGKPAAEAFARTLLRDLADRLRAEASK